MKKRSVEHWYWKFRDNPAGQNIRLAVADSGRIIGQYAAIPVKMQHNGKIITASQIVDSMITKEYRNALGKTRIFVNVANDFFKTYGESGFVSLMYGFPNDMAKRIGQRFLGYGSLPRVEKLVKRLTLTDIFKYAYRTSHLRKIGYIIERVESFSEKVDTLWQECKSELKIAAIRNKKYLNWRYADCPGKKYTLWQVYDKNREKLLAIAVSCRQGASAQIVDLLFSRQNTEICLLLIRHIERLYRTRGAVKLEIWLPDFVDLSKLLSSRCGYKKEPTPFLLSCRSFSPTCDPDWFKDNFYLTMGDTDIY